MTVTPFPTALPVPPLARADADAVLAELRTVSAELADLIRSLESGTTTGELAGQLARGAAGTRRIPGKHGAAAVRYEQVVVTIPDEPGALARLFADVEAAGVNVEDIAIEHDQAREIGYLALSVAPEQAEALVTTMRGGGWAVAAEPLDDAPARS